MVSTLKLTKIQIPNSDSDVISLDASSGNITVPKPVTFSETLGGTSITVQGEGTATTNLQQGIAKCWFQIIQNTTHTIQDSFNVGSIVDAGEGETTVNYSNVMANSDWSGVLTAQSANNRRAMNNGPNTIRIKVEVYQVSTNSSPADATGGVSGTVHGDLA